MDWTRAQQVFDQASELHKDQVDAFLASACGDDPELCNTVRDLLQEAESSPSGFFESIVAQEARGLTNRDGQRVGAYVIEREIGRGGMGEVFLAHRTEGGFEQHIAIKIVRRGLAIDEILDRFRQERQILARLDHPNIVRLLDGGSTLDGLPYLAMDYVDGVPITSYCAANQLDLKARCRLMLPIFAGVAHAHRHLIVHRDLKPANILVTSGGVPKLLDFGIAKLLDAGAEVTHLRPLTPDYASPEQMSGAPITTATDVYQLGTILFRLAADKAPSEAATTTLPGDLDNIVKRAMHSDAERRYSSPEQLADDLERYLENRPVLARADSFWYTARKRMQRSPLAAASIALAVLSTLIGGGLAYYQGRRAERRFDQVRNMATTFAFQFDERIRDLPGSLPARVFAVDTAVKHLDSLRGEAFGDLDLQSEIAEAYMQAASIQGAPSSPNIGKPDQGVESCDKAIGLTRAILASNPQARAALRTLTQALTTKGQILTVLRRARKVEGIELLREAMQTADRLGATPGLGSPEYRAMAHAYQRWADYLVPTAPKDAAVFYTKCLEAGEKALGATPSPELRATSLSALMGLARVQRDLGKTEDVAGRLETVVSILEPLLAKNPASVNINRQLSLAYEELASALGNPLVFHMNDSPRALRVIRKALALQEAKREANASQDAAKRNFDIMQRVARLKLVESEILLILDPAASREAVRVGLALYAKTLAIDPENKLNMHRLQNLDHMLARLHLRAGRPAAAIPILEKIVGNDRADLSLHADDLSALDDLGIASAELGIALNGLQQWEQAEKHLTDTIAGTAKTLAAYPEDLYFIRNHARALEVFGDHYRLRGDTSRSVKYDTEALELWRRWSKLAAPSPYQGLYIALLERKLADPGNRLLVAPGLER